MVGGIFATVLVAFVVFGFSDARPSATAAISLTLLGVVWVGGGLAVADAAARRSRRTAGSSSSPF